MGTSKEGDLRSATEYAAQFPERADLYQKCVPLFQQDNYLSCDVDSSLQGILLIYQKYYRNAFYLGLSAEDAAERLRARLAELFQTGHAAPLDELEEKVVETFRGQSMYALAGRAGGYYGPCIWRSEELRHFAVGLKSGLVKPVKN